MNQMLIHRVIEIGLSEVDNLVLDNGTEYTCRHMVVTFEDWKGNEQQMQFSFFADNGYQLLITDPTLEKMTKEAA